jgi:hypothetical protein
VYAVANPTPIAQGAATLERMGSNWLSLTAQHPGVALVRVNFSPYWAITQGSGCVAPAGQFTKLIVDRSGPIRLAIRFSLARVHARSPRCDRR